MGRLCLPDDLVKTHVEQEWAAGRLRPSHPPHPPHPPRSQHPAPSSTSTSTSTKNFASSSLASHGSRMDAETPSRAARASAAFRQDRETRAQGSLQRVACRRVWLGLRQRLWQPSIHRRHPCRAHAICSPLLSARCGSGSFVDCVAVRNEQRLDGERGPRTSQPARAGRPRGRPSA